MIAYRPLTHDDVRWFQERLNVALASDVIGTVAEVDGNRGAMVTLERWSDNAVWIHLVIDDPKVCQGRALFRRVCDFVFKEQGRRYLLSTTSSVNERSLKLQKALGLVEIGRVPDGFGEGDDIVILRLDAGDWYSRTH